MNLSEWIGKASEASIEWYIKRLSANDTQQTGGHQAGPYIPKALAFRLYPQLKESIDLNPRVEIELRSAQSAFSSEGSLIYYNNKRIADQGTRDETRLTGLGGGKSPLLDPDNTGAIAVFAYDQRDLSVWHYWICSDEFEEALLEEVIGPVDPGETVFWSSASGRAKSLTPMAERSSCWLQPADIPPDWLVKFPSGAEIINKAIELRSSVKLEPDERLLKRRDCEYEVFQSIEEAFYTPKLQTGFNRLEPFLALAQSILQSRKSRAGKSLEYHAKAIFDEAGMVENKQYSYNREIEGGKKPDFIFPSVGAYNDKSFPDDQLSMLGVKTTCKDRWRQILNEADRIKQKHLLTLQEGVSEAQFREITNAGIVLVVPARLHKKFPASVRPELTTLESFISKVSA